MKKKLSVILLGLSLLLPSMPSFAAETIDVSGWALADVAEGEKYGIYPMGWYETSLKQPISQEKLDDLYKGVNLKLQQAHLSQTKEVSRVEGMTRGDVILGLYSQLAQYEEAMQQLNPQNLDAVTYFKHNGYVKGTNLGLELEKACTVEQAIVLATHFIEGTYAQLDEGAKGLGYKITNKENTIYMLGSIHVGTSEMYPVSKSLKEAFNESEALFVEANILNPQQGMEGYLAKAQYNDGTTLKDHISSETYEKTAEVLSGYGLPMEVYNQFRPWCVAADIANLALIDEEKGQEAGAPSILGVDRYFLEKALFNDREVLELEGLEYQADLFNGLTAAVQEEYLLDTVEAALNPVETSEVDTDLISNMQDYWYEGEYDKFVGEYGEALAKTNDELTTMLLGTRDEDMANKISQLLEKEGKHTYFVVIGAAHVVMPDMTADKLKEKGYKVERFK